jgi:uncharacterized protein involved in exopolysaccharide biosynthesis
MSTEDSEAPHPDDAPPGARAATTYALAERLTTPAEIAPPAEIGLQRLRGVIARRKVPMLVTMVATTGIAAALLWQVPPLYTAQAVIRASEAQPGREYVAPTVAEQLGERLKSLRLAVMARPLVAQAVDDLGLLRLAGRVTRDELVDRIRERMDVRVEGTDTFLLTYSDPMPERARAIVDRVATLFMKREVGRREQIATTTVDTLRSEASSLAGALAQAERAVRDFRMRHYGALPEQEEANLRVLDQTTMEINIQATNLDTDLERQRQLQRSALSPLRHNEELLATQLYEARTHYTEDNPEVRRVSDEYERVRTQRVSDERQLTDRLRRANPELAALDGEIGRTRGMLQALRQRQGELHERVRATAHNGGDLAGLTATLAAARDKHTATVGHLRDAELALELERNLAALRFDLIEGAALPSHASAPDRPVLAAGALALALALAIGLGFFLDAADHAVRQPVDLARVGIGAPVLACIPKINHRGTVTPRREA